MEGLAAGAPKSKGVKDVPERIAVLERFEHWGNLNRFPIEEVVGEEKWAEYWSALQEIHDKMQAAQLIAEGIQRVVQQRYTETRTAT